MQLLQALPGGHRGPLRERFLRESRLAASIDHPNVLPVIDVGVTDGSLFLVMPLVAGGSLAEQRTNLLRSWCYFNRRNRPLLASRSIRICRSVWRINGPVLSPWDQGLMVQSDPLFDKSGGVACRSVAGRHRNV
jgi:serine/threonine protein kinase